MKTEIQIVDRGRGLQLSTSRVTVQDLVPYFQKGCSNDEIIRWIPTLSPEEIAFVERYYQEHQVELDEEDRLIRERNANLKNPPWVEKIAAEAAYFDYEDASLGEAGDGLLDYPADDHEAVGAAVQRHPRFGVELGRQLVDAGTRLVGRVAEDDVVFSQRH